MWSSLLTRREKYSVAILSVFAFTLRIPLALRPELFLSELPYGDDAFYVFSIARNIAAGHGISVDGTHLTNGFQPLILLFYTPIFWLCGHDAWLAVRWTFIVNGVIAALCVWAVALLVRSQERTPQTHGLTAPIIAAAIWTFTFEIFTHITNGLETGLSSLLLLIAMTLFANLENDHRTEIKLRWRRWLALGIVLGLAVLARIDAAFFVAILTFVLFVKRRNTEAIIVSTTALIASVPWWIFNAVNFGSLMPTSGQAENSWPLPKWENITEATKTLSNMLSLIFYIPGNFGILGWITSSLTVIGILAFVCYRTKLINQLQIAFRLRSLFPVLLFSIALFMYYVFLFRSPHFIARYLQPLRILWSILVAASISMLWNKKKARPVVLGIATLGLAFGVERYTDNYFPTHPNFNFYEMGLWANEHPTEKIAMLQSGIASFIAPNVINLDGKVNADALHAHQQGRLAAYLRDEHFTYIADWKPFIEDIAAIARKDELYFDSVGMIDDVQLMKRRDATAPFAPTPATSFNPPSGTHSK
jgi:hypothetical protein